MGPRSRGKRLLEFDGISIVNGAQTTGSIGSLVDDPGPDLLVPVRFVKSEDENLLASIVRYNNLQNKVQAADFRSGDEIQNRLRFEFEGMPGVSYDGGRRGGSSDVIKRSRAALPSHTVGQVLTAFHGDPVAAYDKRAEIWIDDSMYSRVFNERTTAAHLLFTYSLHDALTTRLLNLRGKVSDGVQLSEAEDEELAFLSLKGAPYLLIEAIARSLETVLGATIPDRFALSFKGTPTLFEASSHWGRVIDATLPMSSQLRPAFRRGRVVREGKEEAFAAFASVFRAVHNLKPDGFTDFAKLVKLSGALNEQK